MMRSSTPTRLGLMLLAALLALPLAPTASPVEAKKRSRTVTRTFGNVAPITLPSGAGVPTPASAGVYPSDVAVRGLKGRIRDVNLRLNDFRHTTPSDAQLLLVGPGGQTAVVMSHVGATDDVDGITLTLDDEAAAPLPVIAALQTGAFRPTRDPGSGLAPFNAPAPAFPSANTALSVFDGTDPNGTWRLFVMDTYGPTDAGTIAGGWELELKVKVKAKNRR